MGKRFAVTCRTVKKTADNRWRNEHAEFCQAVMADASRSKLLKNVGWNCDIRRIPAQASDWRVYAGIESLYHCKFSNNAPAAISVYRRPWAVPSLTRLNRL